MPSLPLPTRQLGRNGPQVTALGFGLMGLSSFYGPPPPDADRFAFLDYLYASGERFWDTSDLYGDSEVLLGRWFALHPDARAHIFLASKFGAAAPGALGSARSDPVYVHEACAASLARLGTSYIDLYYVHRVDGVTPIEDTMAALVALQAAGRIRHIGLSEVSPATLRRACAVHHVAALQIEYSPFELLVERPLDGPSAGETLLHACRDLGIALVAYSPLGRGLLTGRYRSPADFDDTDCRQFMPRFSAANFAQNLALVDTLAALAATKKCTAGQLALAWLLHQGDDIIPIPGTKKAAYLDENLGALDVQLTEAEAAAIRKAVDAAEVAGARYPEGKAGILLGDTPEKSA